MSGIGVDDEICAGCFRSIDPADEVDCPRCGSPHHSVCWEQEGGCTVVGCGAEEEVRSSPVEAAARDSEPSVPVQPEPAVVDLDLGAGADEPLVGASPAAAETQKAAPIETLAPSSTEPEPTPPPEPSVAIPTPATPPLPSAPQVSEAVLAPPAPPPPPPAPAANWSPPPPRPTPTPVAATPTVAAPPPPPAVKSPTPHTPAEAEGNRVAHSAATGQPLRGSPTPSAGTNFATGTAGSGATKSPTPESRPLIRTEREGFRSRRQRVRQWPLQRAGIPIRRSGSDIATGTVGSGPTRSPTTAWWRPIRRPLRAFRPLRLGQLVVVGTTSGSPRS